MIRLASVENTQRVDLACATAGNLYLAIGTPVANGDGSRSEGEQNGYL
jgi:hypothetical protein